MRARACVCMPSDARVVARHHLEVQSGPRVAIKVEEQAVDDLFAHRAADRHLEGQRVLRVEVGGIRVDAILILVTSRHRASRVVPAPARQAGVRESAACS